MYLIENRGEEDFNGVMNFTKYRGCTKIDLDVSKLSI